MLTLRRCVSRSLRWSWTGSWTEPSAQPVQLALSAARLGGIRAGSAPGAPGRASHNPPVVGSSPIRPTCGFTHLDLGFVDRFDPQLCWSWFHFGINHGYRARLRVRCPEGFRNRLQIYLRSAVGATAFLRSSREPFTSPQTMDACQTHTGESSQEPVLVRMGNGLCSVADVDLS